ncbi:NHLP bacteriocin system secretion protein [Legionella micdadei]|uniref:NHLM bacteriocin system secretion protein n=1 Tax=Legionella micdadei TaxID=451 RepID=A0A098GHP4_LEGMI|nr:NHLP bacteriocin system secretion protein [Legionella micdadei]KTD26781.1 pyruvate carboxylase subunit B [Legionella micdadei]NSL18282.1 NHLP bacteriocin system secretion protein [Legionella micdadei]CEG61520.1 protein of unknown function [Coiled-coil domain] [Legionella micdadei]SCY44962.1 NHLM bacteriocin system secretion protein [Legionella micdadei]
MVREESQKLFRKEALIHLTTPEQLNKAITITGSKSWLLLLTLTVTMVLVIVWSILGKINTRVEGDGIILSDIEGIYNAVAPKGAGEVERILVKPGDTVKAGQLVMTFNNLYLQNQIVVAQQALAELQQKNKEMSAEAKIGIANRHKDLITQNTILENIITQQNENLIHAQELLTIRQDAFKRGLITRQEVVSSWQQYYDIRKNIEDARKEISQNLINEKNYVESWADKLRSIDLKIKDKKEELDSLISQLKTGKNVYSPITGRVTNIQVKLGDMAKEGTPVLSLSPLDINLEVIAYVPINQGKKIKKGMITMVTPGTIKKEEYGSIIGYVDYVAPYPATSESMNAVLKNEDLVKKLIENPTMEIRVNLQKDPTTFSGFKWSSSEGPPQKITAGTMVEVSTIVRKQAPVTLIIPGLKKLFGSY